MRTHDFLEPSTPLLCPTPNPPPCGLATSGSNYQPGRPDLIGTFQISEEEGGGTDSLELTNQGSFPLVLGVLPILYLIDFFFYHRPDSDSEICHPPPPFCVCEGLDSEMGYWRLGARAGSSHWVGKNTAFPLHPYFKPPSQPCHPRRTPPLQPPSHPQPGPSSQPCPPSVPGHHPGPSSAPAFPSLPTLAPLPALYSSKLAPHSCSTPVRPPPGTTDS